MLLCCATSLWNSLAIFLDLEGGPQKATLVVLVVISSLPYRNPQGFLTMQWSAMNLCIHMHADIAHKSTISDFPRIF